MNVGKLLSIIYNQADCYSTKQVCIVTGTTNAPDKYSTIGFVIAYVLKIVLMSHLNNSIL